MATVTSRAGLDTDRLLALYRQMQTIRRCEEHLARAHQRGLVHGACHTYVGEEAIAAGVCAHLRADDVVFSTHRGHGHALAKGVEPRALAAELLGRATGLLARPRRQHAPLRARGRPDGHQRDRRPVHPPGRRRRLQLQAPRIRPRGRGLLRRRRREQRRLPRRPQHGQHLEAARAVRLREQRVRHRGPVPVRQRQPRRRRPAPRATACPASRSTATTSWRSGRPRRRPSAAPAAAAGRP